jgi:hypothetical protein
MPMLRIRRNGTSIEDKALGKLPTKNTRESHRIDRAGSLWLLLARRPHRSGESSAPAGQFGRLFGRFLSRCALPLLELTGQGPRQPEPDMGLTVKIILLWRATWAHRISLYGITPIQTSAITA